MVALIENTNTKELREQGEALFKKAHKFREEAPKNDNGQLSDADHATALQMMADSKKFFEQAQAIESGNDVSLEEKAERGDFNVNQSEFEAMQNDRFNAPISIAMGTRGATIDLNPSNPIQSLMGTALPESVLESQGSFNKNLISRDYHRDFMDFITRPKDQMGHRPASLSSQAHGGYTAICNPIRFAANVLRKCRDRNWIRQLGTVITLLDACSTGITQEQETESSAAWGDACKPPKACATPAFAVKTLSPEFMAYCACLCRVILNQRCVINVEEFIAQKLADDSGDLEEEAFLWGDGKKKPLGIFYDPGNSDDYCGADAGTDFVTDCMFTCGIDWTFFVKAYMALPECTRNNPGSLAWLFHGNIICQMMLMCDGNGRPLWLNSLEAGLPARFLNIPVRESSRAPSKFEPGKFWGALADFSGYYIADGLNQSTERDDNIFTNKACWVGRRAVDGMIVQPEKFRRLKCDDAGEVTEEAPKVA